MLENQKVLIKNLTNHSVGFGCANFPNHYEFGPGQIIPVKWEHLEDAGYTKGLRYLFENTYLKIMPETENYEEIMEDLQLTHLKEVIDNSLSYEEVKKILNTNPLSTQYGLIKKQLNEGTITTKENFAKAAIELEIRDYVVNNAVKQSTGIDILKTLELNSTSKEKE